jgi:GTPase SAR1 family protein
VFLVGNKIDLESNRKVSKDQAEQYKTENKLNYFTETSAKTGFNAKEVFIEAAKVLYRDYTLYKEKSGSKSVFYFIIAY